MSPHWSRSDAQCDLWPWQSTQKKKEKRHPRQWQTGYSPRPPTLPYGSQSLHAGWSLVCSSIFKVLLKSVQWFRRCGLSKIALPHYFGLYNSLYHRTSRDHRVCCLHTECDVIRSGPTNHRARSCQRCYYELQRVRQFNAGPYYLMITMMRTIIYLSYSTMKFMLRINRFICR